MTDQTPSEAGDQVPPPPPPPSYMPPGSAPQGQYAGGKTETMAIAALVVGIVGLILMPLILGVGAVVMANSAQKRIQASGGALGGENLVRAGRIIGIVDIVLGLIILVVVVLANS